MNESRRNLLAFFISILVLLIATTSYSNLHPQFQRMGFVLTVLGILAWLLLRYPSGRRLSIPLVVLPLGALVLLGYVMSLRSPVPIIPIEKVSQSFAHRPGSSFDHRLVIRLVEGRYLGKRLGELRDPILPS